MINQILQVLILGSVISFIYMIITAGFTLLCSVGGFIDVCYTLFLVIAAYLYWILCNATGIPVLALIITILSVGFIAVAHYWIVVKPIRDKPLNIYFMTLLMMYMFEQIFILLFSPSPKNVQPLISGVIAIGGVRFPTNLLIAIALSLVSLWMLTYVVNNTYPGRAIRAASMDLEASRLMGISPDKIQAFTYLIAGVLGGIGGVFYASYVVASPDMWVYPLIVIFATVIVGGVGSIKGAFIASTIIGYTEIIVTYVWDPKGRGLFALAMMILILLIRPSGLFGR